MSIYLAAQVAVYHHLLARHAQDDAFRFSMRKKFRQNPSTEQGLFAGTAPVFSFSLWHVPISSSFFRKEVISYVIRVKGNATFELSAEVSLPKEQYVGSGTGYVSNSNLSYGLLTELLKHDDDAAGPRWRVRLRAADSQQQQLEYAFAPSALPSIPALLKALDEVLEATITGIDAAMARYARETPAWIGQRISPAEFDLMREQVEQRYADLLVGHFPPPVISTRNYWTAQIEARPAAWAEFRRLGIVRPLFYQLLTSPANGSGDGSKSLNQVRAGDLIIVTRGPRRVLGVGMATGQFTHDSEQPPHFCPVDWVIITPVELTGSPFTTGSMPWNRTTKWPQIQEAYAQLSSPPPGLEQLIRGEVSVADANSASDEITVSEPDSAAIQGSSPNYWAIGAGEGGTFWNSWQAEGLMSIGWEAVGDLRRYATDEPLRQALKQHYGSGTTHDNNTLACWQFCREIRPGDYVVVKIGRRKILGVGKVMGDYYFEPARPVHSNVRPMHWLLTGWWEDKAGPGVPTKTLTSITGYHTFLKPILAELAEPKHLQPIEVAVDAQAQAKRLEVLKQRLRPALDSLPRPAPPPLPPYALAQAEQDFFLSTDQIRHLQAALRRKKNLIVQGPPGVGKTYVARRLAWLQMGEQDPSRVQLVQFHQSYSYEDFIRGWRPTESGGFELANGVFVDFVRRAQHDPDRDYFFLIDEINRGNLSKIFGELLLLLEADKRHPDFALPLTYRKPGEAPFYVPPNLYVIGTMNTADRSLALVDYALRRRFTFVDLIPMLGDKLRQHLVAGQIPEELAADILTRVAALNLTIKEDKNLGSGFLIGHSYFCTPLAGETPADWWAAIVSHDLAPLLREYWFDSEAKASKAIAALHGPA